MDVVSDPGPGDVVAPDGALDVFRDTATGPDVIADTSVPRDVTGDVAIVLDVPGDVPVAVDAPSDVPRDVCPGMVCGALCVDAQTDPVHCGACDNACAAPDHGAATCTAGACGVACVSGYHPCGAACAADDDATACGAACAVCATVPWATPVCTAGACAQRCTAGHDDCDGDASTGCETELATAAAHCGACGHACAAGEMCSAGACVPLCGRGVGAVDQSNPAGGPGGLAVASDLRVGQSFIAGITGHLTGAEVPIQRYHVSSMPTASVRLTVYDDAGAALGSADRPLSSVTIPPSMAVTLGPGAPGAEYFDLSASCIHLSAGATYRLEVSMVDVVMGVCSGTPVGRCAGGPFDGSTCSGARSCEEYVGIFSDTAGRYPSGTEIGNGVPRSVEDIVFRTFVE